LDATDAAQFPRAPLLVSGVLTTFALAVTYAGATREVCPEPEG